MMDNLDDICNSITDIKQQMAVLKAQLEAYEGAILAEVPTKDEGSTTHQTQGGNKITITKRVNRTIDDDKLQSIAREHGLTHYLSALFSWKPAIKAKEWRSANKEVTDVLSEAITSKPGKPSIKIN